MRGFQMHALIDDHDHLCSNYIPSFDAVEISLNI